MQDVVPWPDRNDPSQRFGLLFRRKRKSDVVKFSDSKTQTEAAGFEHVGNVTRTDDSLLVRKARAARYSKKYREGVVDKILSGNSTITQVRNDLGLSERDLLDWINDRVMKQDLQIAKLGQIVETVKQLATDGSAALGVDGSKHRLKLHSENLEELTESKLSAQKGATIDGRVNRG